MIKFKCWYTSAIAMPFCNSCVFKIKENTAVRNHCIQSVFWMKYLILRYFRSTVKRMLNKQLCLESFKTTPEISLYFRQALRIFISILICRFKKANYDIIQTCRVIFISKCLLFRSYLEFTLLFRSISP